MDTRGLVGLAPVRRRVDALSHPVSIVSHHLPPLDLVVVHVPPECLITAAGELDLATAPALAGTVRGLDRAGELVTLDLRALTFMDVAGLRALIDARRFVRRTGRRLQILGPGEQVARVLELTGTRDLVN
jgi:anti-sigma B factor antagonist